MNFNPVLDVLRRRTGLDPVALGENPVSSAIQHRMTALGIVDPFVYASRLRDDDTEFFAYVSEIVVPETWFFRNPETFESLAKFAQTVLRDRQGGRIRILSAGCSTGEEVYTIAIALHKIGIPLASCEIEGVDLSPRHIEKARQARYNDFSFRSIDASAMAPYFRHSEGFLELLPFIRDAVRFRVANLADPVFLVGERPYDIILCRNVLIYFTAEARKNVLSRLERLLASGGVLALGHAESNELDRKVWERFGSPTHGIFRRLKDVFIDPLNPVLTPATWMAPKPTDSGTLRPISPVGIPNPSQARSMPPIPSTTVPLPLVSSQPATDCWNKIGVQGDRTCAELEKVVHCHNCPVFANAGKRFLDNPSPMGYLNEWTARLADSLVEAEADLLSLLTFRIGSEWLALRVPALSEVSPPREIRRLPHRRGLLAGLINIRGELLPCVKLDELLTLTRDTRSPHERMIVTGGKERWVFFVDEVDRVRRIPYSEIMATPATVARAAGRYTKGTWNWEGKTAGLLDDVRLFDTLRERIR